MPLPAALLFDMDGTIVDNMSYHTDTWLEMLRERGVETTAEEFFANTAGMPNPAILRHYFGDAMGPEAVAAFDVEKEETYRRLYGPHVRPMPGLVELLDWARENGIRLGLATSAPPQNIAFTLAGCGLTDAFDQIVGAKDVTHGKPHPEIYLTCAARLGVEPKDCVVFEDAPMGIESALRAGMRVFVLTTVLSAEHAQAIAGVERVIADFREAESLF